MIWPAVVPSPRPPGRGIGYSMSMQPAAWSEPDPQIAAAVAAMYARRKTPRPLAVQIRDRLGSYNGGRVRDLTLQVSELFSIVRTTGMNPERYLT